MADITVLFLSLFFFFMQAHPLCTRCLSVHVMYWSVLTCLTYLQVHPLALHSEDHLNDLQHQWEAALPAVHLLLKGLDEPGCLHGGQGHLVVLQGQENLLCSPGREGGQGRRVESLDLTFECFFFFLHYFNLYESTMPACSSNVLLHIHTFPHSHTRELLSTASFSQLVCGFKPRSQ